jgi:hypothetical protein
VRFPSGTIERRQDRVAHRSAAGRSPRDFREFARDAANAGVWNR